MHPYKIFDLNIERVTALIGTHTALHDKRGKPEMVVTDVMRASVVLTVSAIDAYLHGVLKLYVGRAAALDPAPKRLLTLINDWKVPPHVILAYMLHEKGPVDLTAAVEAHFADRTLQDPTKVADVFDMLSIPDIWAKVAAKLQRPEKEVKDEFARIVKRRHRIAHEADIDHSGKTANKKSALPRPKAEEYRDAVAAVAKAMNETLLAKFP